MKQQKCHNTIITLYEMVRLSIVLMYKEILTFIVNTLYVGTTNYERKEIPLPIPSMALTAGFLVLSRLF